MLDHRHELRTERHQLQQHANVDRQFSRSLDRDDHRLFKGQQRLDALDTWSDWANGHTPRPAALINAARHLDHTRGHHALFAEPLTTWIHEYEIAPAQPAPPDRPAVHHTPRPEPPGLGIGL